MVAVHRTTSAQFDLWAARCRLNNHSTHHSRHRAFRVEYLEGRTLLSHFDVINLNDSGYGSLRQAIVDSNSTPGPNEIDFATGLSGTIKLTSGELRIANNPVTILGPGQDSLSVSGGGNGRVFEVAWGVRASLSGMSITRGHAEDGSGNSAVGPYLGAGGGILNFGTLAITDSTISGNSIGANGAGGGIWNSGTITITDGTIKGNASGSDGAGGGIYNSGTISISASTFNGNSGDYGGGIYNDLAGTMTINTSTISHNSGTNFPEGGGIANWGRMTIDASTISGNSAFLGGGIINLGELTSRNCTLSGNSAVWAGAIQQHRGTLTIIADTISANRGKANFGGVYLDGGTTILSSSVVAGNSGGDVAGDFTSLGHNLIGNSDGNSGWIATDLVNVDPKLGPLQDNGGPTMTMALLPGSPAIDAGSNNLVPAGVKYDQRGPGFQRIVNATGTPTATVDIGAFEWQPYVSSFVVSWGTQTAPLKTAADNVRVLPVGRKTDLPWLNVKQLTITLSTAESLTPADVTVSSTSGTNYGPVTISGSGTNYTITMSQPIMRPDRVTIMLNLAGIVTRTYELDVLPGDFNDDGAVTMADRTALMQHFGAKLGQSVYDSAFDVNGDGIINLLDYMAWLKWLGSRI
jgi:hypothetical protein